MGVYVVCALLLIATSAPAVAQEYENQDRVHQDPGLVVLSSVNIDDIGSRAEAVVVGRFVGATGTTENEEEGGWGASVVTTMRFSVQEVLKGDARIPSTERLEVRDAAGGGEYTKSKPHRVLKLSETAEKLQVGHTYLLYLGWDERSSAFFLSASAPGVFDLTGDKVTALIDALDFAKRAPTMDKAAAIQALRESAVAVGRKPLHQRE